MKKYLLCLLVICCGLLTRAQDYRCLQPGVKRYFTNTNGYLRGMRIDSVRALGSDSLYYPFHTLRGNYDRSSFNDTLDPRGGSWLGKKVIRKTDGTFLFDNIWNDTIVIRSQAHYGDTWTFYNDTTHNYYTARIIAVDTMTVLGALDSVKTIQLYAYTDTGFVAADSINYLRILLSKDHGFVTVPDLYMFPYRKGDSAYRPGWDYYLDNLGPYYSTLIGPWKLSFSLVQLVNPTFDQLYDWHSGDVFENSVCLDGFPGTCIYPYQYYFDSITDKMVYPDSIRFYFTGWSAEQIYGFVYHEDSNYPYRQHSISGSFLLPNRLLIDTTLMPEEYGQHYMQFYYANDGSLCFANKVFKFVETNFQDSVYVTFFEAGPVSITYKTGIGLQHFFWSAAGGSPPETKDTTLMYFRKSGVPCGTYTVPPLSVGDPASSAGHFSLFPNPASDELTITTTLNEPYTLTFINAIGQVIKTQSIRKPRATINVSTFPPGLYNIVLTTSSGNRATQKVTILH